MNRASGRHYRALFGGSLLIFGIFFLLFLFRAPDLLNAFKAVLLAITLGISLGTSFPGILFCVVAASCLMGYGLVVRKKYALAMFWGGFALFFLAGTMGLGARY